MQAGGGCGSRHQRELCYSSTAVQQYSTRVCVGVWRSTGGSASKKNLRPRCTGIIPVRGDKKNITGKSGKPVNRKPVNRDLGAGRVKAASTAFAVRYIILMTTRTRTASASHALLRRRRTLQVTARMRPSAKREEAFYNKARPRNGKTITASGSLWAKKLRVRGVGRSRCRRHSRSCRRCLDR